MSGMNEADLRLVEIYREFLPKRIFDAHMHMYLGEAIPKVRGTGVFQRDDGTVEAYLHDMAPIMPGVEEIRLHMMPFPDPALKTLGNGLRRKANGYISRLAENHPGCVGAAYILPEDTEQDIADMLRYPGICSLKPYYYGAKNPSGSSRIGEFLPEAAWVVANETGRPIILHMMRSNLADPDNFSYIETMTARYPDAPLVLAHCARGFAGWTAVKYIPKLTDRENIWFDLSAVCETGPMMASVLKTAGKRTMWGSDWPICLNRGRPISLVDDQLWLLNENGALIASEALFAFYQASLLLELDTSQLEDIFLNNAMALFKRII